MARSRLACSRAKAGAVLRRARGDFAASVVVPLGGRLASRSSWRRAAGVLLELFNQPNILTGGCGSVRRGCPALGHPSDDVYEVRVVCEGAWGPITQKRARCICPLARLGSVPFFILRHFIGPFINILRGRSWELSLASDRWLVGEG